MKSLSEEVNGGKNGKDSSSSKNKGVATSSSSGGQPRKKTRIVEAQVVSQDVEGVEVGETLPSRQTYEKGKSLELMKKLKGSSTSLE